MKQSNGDNSFLQIAFADTVKPPDLLVTGTSLNRAVLKDILYGGIDTRIAVYYMQTLTWTQQLTHTRCTVCS